MIYPLLKFFHLVGLTLMGASLIGVWFSDLRSRQARQLSIFAEAIRSIRVFYDGLVVPGALLLLGSGTWLIVTVYGGWAFLAMPWLVGMVGLFAFEFIDARDPPDVSLQRFDPGSSASASSGDKGRSESRGF